MRKTRSSFRPKPQDIHGVLIDPARAHGLMNYILGTLTCHDDARFFIREVVTAKRARQPWRFLPEGTHLDKVRGFFGGWQPDKQVDDDQIKVTKPFEVAIVEPRAYAGAEGRELLKLRFLPQPTGQVRLLLMHQYGDVPPGGEQKELRIHNNTPTSTVELPKMLHNNSAFIESCLIDFVGPKSHLSTRPEVSAMRQGTSFLPQLGLKPLAPTAFAAVA